MKVIQDTHVLIILCFTFLIASVNSCSTQSQSNPDIQKTEIDENVSSIATKLETTVRLSFKAGIRSILEDSNGNIWFGSYEEGVCKLNTQLPDGHEDKMTYFTTDDGLCDNQIRSIFEDSNGMVWFEGGKGISSYDGKIIITHLMKNYNSKYQWQSDQNDLWFKGDESFGYNQLEGQSGVYRYDGNMLNYHLFPFSAEENDNMSYSISTPAIKGKNGMVWFGAYGAVIGYNDLSLPIGKIGFTILNDKTLGLNEATGNLHIRSIFEDSKGKLWIGNNGIGVLKYDGDTTINFSAQQGLISENSLKRGGYRSPVGSLEHVFSIGEDLKGNMWFGDRDTGAWRYDGKSMKNYTLKDGLTTTHIWQIYNAKNGELWFAMDDGNVLKFNSEPVGKEGKSFVRIF